MAPPDPPTSPDPPVPPDPSALPDQPPLPDPPHLKAKYDAWTRDLVNSYESALQAYFTKCARGNENLAESWTSDVFVAMWQHRAEYSSYDEAHMNAVLWLAAKNKAIDEGRKRKAAREGQRERTFEKQIEGKPRVTQDPPPPMLGEMSDEERTKIALAQAMEELSPYQRKIMELFAIHGKTPQEIVTILGGKATEDTVNSALRTARLKIKAAMKKFKES